MALPLAGAKIKAADLLGIFPGGVDGWTTYTPVWSATGTQPAIGNGSIAGSYMKIGRLVVFKVSFATGTTSTYGTGSYLWSLPPFTNALAAYPYGLATLIDSSAGVRYNRTMIPQTASTFVLTTEANVPVGQTVPMTWATGDSMFAWGSYEATS